MPTEALTPIGILIGVLSPFLTALIQRPYWSNVQRSWIAVGVSFILGTATVFVSGAITGEVEPLTIFTTIATVLASAQSSYMLLKNTGLVTKLELKSSPKDGKHERTE